VADKGTYWRHAPDCEYAVLGDPVGHSWSPKMHNAALKHLGRTERYEAIHVPLEELEEALDELQARGVQGVNCTVPLKEEAFRLSKHLDSEAIAYGAVNTLRLSDRAGINTDVPGFFETLRDAGLEPPGPVLMLGAGGTARSLLVGFGQRGWEIRLWTRRRERAEELALSLGVCIDVVDHPDVLDNSLIVNATSAGLSGDALDIAWGQGHACLAYDLLYAAEPTPFLRDARMAGLPTLDGRDMLVAQGALSLEWWLGVEAPREVMRAALG